MSQKFLFIDRDGTLIAEPPEDFQVAGQPALEPEVIPALRDYQQDDHQSRWLVPTVSHRKTFDPPHNLMDANIALAGHQFRASANLPASACG